ncbi:HAMP domain-containing protein [Jiangella asiatica]|uniref:histidine kinase n=2 Tax=Jiangella asiatica TaxID=2530372 RepID=A0A4R5CQB3_9ACTN|nr:HAMP domain-containing protein [Jiangella asiatica]
MMYFLVSQSLLDAPSSRRDLLDDEVERRTAGIDETVRSAIEAYRAETLHGLLTWSIVALGAALVLAGVLGWFLAGRALRPLQQVTETARRVAERNLHERIGLTGPKDELRELADTFDAMLERLDRSFDAQRTFVANASHELRTPLAVNRTLLEVALGEPDISDDLRRLAPTLLATNERSERLVEGLLTLARSEQSVTEPVAVDLREITSAVLDQEKGEATRHGMAVTSQLRHALTTGNGVLLERMVVNLVQNAIRHGGPDGTARVWTGPRDGWVAIQVENTGPKLGTYEVEGLFEPFRRGEGRSARGQGVGLGLSIVRSIARAHGGRVVARPRDQGGLLIRVDLPARVQG